MHSDVVRCLHRNSVIHENIYSSKLKWSSLPIYESYFPNFNRCNQITYMLINNFVLYSNFNLFRNSLHAISNALIISSLFICNLWLRNSLLFTKLTEYRKTVNVYSIVQTFCSEVSLSLTKSFRDFHSYTNILFQLSACLNLEDDSNKRALLKRRTRLRPDAFLYGFR